MTPYNPLIKSNPPGPFMSTASLRISTQLLDNTLPVRKYLMIGQKYLMFVPDKLRAGIYGPAPTDYKLTIDYSELFSLNQSIELSFFQWKFDAQR